MCVGELVCVCVLMSIMGSVCWRVTEVSGVTVCIGVCECVGEWALVNVLASVYWWF